MKQTENGIYYFLGNITSHILHALPLYKEIGGTFVVTSKRAANEIHTYNVPVVCLDNQPYKWMKPGRRPKRVHEYTVLDSGLKKTYDFLNTHAKVIVFYELFDLEYPDLLKKPKKIFIPHGNMLKSYMTMHPERLKILENYNYMAALSPYMKELFIRDGIAPEKLVDIGIARVDDLLDDNRNKDKLRRSLMSKLHLDQRKKIILYAPTFWGASSIYTTGLDIIKHISDDCTLLFRPHPQTPSKILRKYHRIIKNKQNVFYTPDTPLTQLLVSCDVFIGDVSSVVLEMLLLDIPIVFAYDSVDHRQSDNDYKSIKEVVRISPKITPHNAHDINSIIMQAAKGGIKKDVWDAVRERVWFSQASQTNEIRNFIQSLLK